MIKIELTEIAGWGPAIRGMRNAMNSWDKSDSFECRELAEDGDCFTGCHNQLSCPMYGVKNACTDIVIGPNDRKLMMNLRNSGTPDHRKYMRMIVVWLDITAPLYWWKEFDTYKVGTVANSCSTMHKIHAKEFTRDDFSVEHLIDELDDEDGRYDEWDLEFRCVVSKLNFARERFLETKDKKYWWQMIQLLPSSYNQKRTIMLNYEVLANMYKSRKNHKLDEWVEFCKWIEELPYSELITGKEKSDG